MKDIPAQVKSRRLHELLKKAAEAENAFIRSREGCVREVLFEDFNGTYTGGYTPEYIKVYVPGRHEGAGMVRLLSPMNDGALGELVR